MIHPLSIGPLVLDYLDTPENITTHSMFQHGLNIQIADYLIYLGDMTKGTVPFGIHFNVADFIEIKRVIESDFPIYEFDNEILSINKIKIDLSHIPIKNKEAFPKFVSLNRALLSLSQYRKGTGYPFAELECLKTIDIDTIPSLVDELIGRGKGLTPSGDDFLVGIMAIHQLQPFLPLAFFRRLEEYIEKKATTDVSISYLNASKLGYFSSPIVEVLKNIESSDLPSYLEKLAASGSTSGKDTIAGMKWAILMQK